MICCPYDFKELACHPIETFRTDPIHIIAAVIGLGAAALTATLALETTNKTFATTELVISVAGTASAAYQLAITKQHIDLREQVEDILDRSGFDERMLTLTTRTYCGRQATRIACEQYGCLEEYERVCEQNAPYSRWTRLPHV